jgi:hypothetical protein
MKTIRGWLALVAWILLATVYVMKYDVEFHSGTTPNVYGQHEVILEHGNRYFNFRILRRPTTQNVYRV